MSKEDKTEAVGNVGKCKLVVVTGDDGKKHLEATCLSKEAREQMAAILEQEAVLRVNPKMRFDDTLAAVEPAAAPVDQPAAAPVDQPAVPAA